MHFFTGAFNTSYPEIYHDISHEIRMVPRRSPGRRVNSRHADGRWLWQHSCYWLTKVKPWWLLLYTYTHIYISKWIYIHICVCMYIYICMSKLKTIHQVSKFLKNILISERQKWTWHLLLSDPSMVCIPPWEEWTSRAAVLPSGKVRCGNISHLDVVNPNGS